MNDRQRTVLYVAMGAVALMLLFPPFYDVHRLYGRTSLGYGLIFVPPGNVDVPLLIAQWFAVLIIAALALFAFRDER